MFGVRKLVKLLRDYCENTSLVGLGYIANQRIHLSERFFWLICILVSSGGSYYVIREYEMSFDSNAISLVLENTRPQDKSQFLAVSVCEISNSISSKKLSNYVKGVMPWNITPVCRYDVEKYLRQVIFPDKYKFGLFQKSCKKKVGRAECPGCPMSDYKEIAVVVRSNCTELLVNCQWNGKSFNCCDYFRPLLSPNGICFVMNSIQATERDGPHWFNTEFGWDVGNVELKLQFNSDVDLQLLNAEDVPFSIMKDQVFLINKPGKEMQVQFRVQNIINDPDVREVAPDIRRCKFPDEVSQHSGYKYYSYNTCVADCIKQLQIKTCNCTLDQYITNKDDNSPSCDFHGLMCLDRKRLLKPQAILMQPWNSNSISCICLPSCTNHEVNIFEDTYEVIPNSPTLYAAHIRQTISTDQFRRQAVRTSLDIVVTFGGILGLFMGASILSGIEIVYFFLVRIFNTRN